jgi:ABC-type branched-subunit amino acid transport system substrate-binding protein
VAVAVGAATLLGSAACGGSGSGAHGRAIVVVSAPLSTAPWIGQFVQRGAQLAADEVGATAGKRIAVQTLDNAGSPQQAAANARRAVSEGAVALITDGVGAAAVADITAAARLPVFVVFEGGASIADPAKRPTIFRLAPADKPMATRLADYLADRHPRVALLADDSSYGRDGLAALQAAFRRDEAPLATSTVVPASASDVTAQVLAARRSGASLLVAWAGAPIVAATVTAARSAGWQVPIYAGPTAEDPLVRQRLASHRGWLDGVGFVSFRITSEIGPAPFEKFRRAYEKRFGVDRVGVREGGRDVVQPPDWAMYSYDAVRLVAAALPKGGSLLDALQNTTITGANGDERGFGPTDREGVSPDDMYIARFAGFVFQPVKDDLLSRGLPPVPQTAA